MKLYPYRQRLVSSPIGDVAAETRARLDTLGLDPPRGPVALTGGSRGVANVPTILRAAGEWLRERGAEPFVAPCMGSHNGATAEGQLAMLAALGVTESTVGMPLRATMDVTRLGELPCGQPVWMDRHCAEAAGVLVVNRVKPHTSFGGPPYGAHRESGLAKMMTVGMGKLEGARAFHRVATADKPGRLEAVARAVLGTGKVWATLAVLEDGYDQTAELHALAPGEVLDREPALLARYAQRYYPRLPVEALNVLLIDTMGKEYSGTGMDTNVIGRRGLSDAPDPPTPRIGSIGVLDLSDASRGNAIGIGLADVVTERLRAKIDQQKTRLNAETAGEPDKAVVPLVLPDEGAAIDWLRDTRGETRWMRIPNTLHLGDLLVSADLLDELPKQVDPPLPHGG